MLTAFSGIAWLCVCGATSHKKCVCIQQHGLSHAVYRIVVSRSHWNSKNNMFRGLKNNFMSFGAGGWFLEEGHPLPTCSETIWNPDPPLECKDCTARAASPLECKDCMVRAAALQLLGQVQISQLPHMSWHCCCHRWC